MPEIHFALYANSADIHKWDIELIDIEAVIDDILATDEDQTTPAKRKSTSQRRKQEMKDLHTTANHLELQLALLKREHQATNMNAWREQAMHHLAERAKAEEEQSILQAQLVNCVKMARNLQTMVANCELWKSLQPFHWNDHRVAQNENTEIFGELLRSIDSRFSMLEPTLRIFQAQDGPSEESDRFALKSVHGNKLCFESTSAFVTPFNYRLADEVLWQSLRNGNFVTSGDQVSVVLESPEIVLTKLVDHATSTIASPTVLYQAVKRFPGKDCVFIVWEISALLSGNSGTWPTNAGIISRGWGRLRPLWLRNGSVGSVREEYSLSSLTALNPSEQGIIDHHKLSLLIEMIMTIGKEKRAKVNQLMENLLVDATVAAKSEPDSG